VAALEAAVFAAARADHPLSALELGPALGAVARRRRFLLGRLPGPCAGEDGLAIAPVVGARLLARLFGVELKAASVAEAIAALVGAEPPPGALPSAERERLAALFALRNPGKGHATLEGVFFPPEREMDICGLSGRDLWFSSDPIPPGPEVTDSARVKAARPSAVRLDARPRARVLLPQSPRFADGSGDDEVAIRAALGDGEELAVIVAQDSSETLVDVGFHGRAER
jgi:hypothetical protein